MLSRVVAAEAETAVQSTSSVAAGANRSHDANAAGNHELRR
ncbi:MAG: hypothetical protein ACR2M0_13025 [Chloroflexia bacterium]